VSGEYLYLGSCSTNIFTPLFALLSATSRPEDFGADGWFISTNDGALYGSGRSGNDPAGDYDEGDRVGVLLDCNDGSLRFFKNGTKHGPGYSAGSVKEPVVAVVEVFANGGSVRMLPHALEQQVSQQV
jgi:hypothetical protein